MEANIPYYHRVLIFLLALAINLHVDVEGCKCRMSKPGTTWCNSDWGDERFLKKTNFKGHFIQLHVLR